MSTGEIMEWDWHREALGETQEDPTLRDREYNENTFLQGLKWNQRFRPQQNMLYS